MILHNNEEDFRDAIQATAEKLKIRDIFVEKDYWVTFVLKELSKSDLKDDVVFKGGTSLSKAFDIIDRFSEDIDLVLLGKEELSGNQIKNKLKKIEKALMVSPLTEDSDYKHSKGSKIRKTGYEYPKTLGEYAFAHATKTLILELNAFANPSPVVKRPIETYIAKFLRLINEPLVSQYELESFEVSVLNINRTFVEKVLSLSRISIGDDESYNSLKKKVRHFYDVHKLLEHQDIQKFIEDSEFEKMLNMALEDDLSNPEFKDSWVGCSLNEVRLFSDMEKVFSNIESTFEGDFKSLLYGDEEISISEVKNSFAKLLEKLPKIEVKPAEESDEE